MRKQLFEELFRVAEERAPSKTRNGICTYLERAFTEKYKASFNKERFIRYYKKYLEEKYIPNNPNGDLLDQCAEYLGYENYEDYVMKKRDNSKKNRSTIKPKGEQMKKEKGKKNKKVIVIINLIAVLILTAYVFVDIQSKSQERWMVWKEGKYVRVDFNASKFYRGLLEPYDQKTLETFKKVENPDCDTRYFNASGQPILWYYKVGKGNLELYTAPGLHPINGKTLKAITRYMIQTHICPNY